jgi:hypothetical protein
MADPVNWSKLRKQAIDLLPLDLSSNWAALRQVLVVLTGALIFFGCALAAFLKTHTVNTVPQLLPDPKPTTTQKDYKAPGVVLLPYPEPASPADVRVDTHPKDLAQVHQGINESKKTAKLTVDAHPSPDRQPTEQAGRPIDPASSVPPTLPGGAGAERVTFGTLCDEMVWALGRPLICSAVPPPAQDRQLESTTRESPYGWRLQAPQRSASTDDISKRLDGDRRERELTTPGMEKSHPTASGFVVVLASKKFRDDALKAFAELQQKYPEVLAGKSPDVKEADLGDKGVWYRAVVGPPGSREAATSVCSQLMTAGHTGCWVAAY